ncbi:hypothetical protein Tco_0873278, partial [Tanacetum coccineum]
IPVGGSINLEGFLLPVLLLVVMVVIVILIVVVVDDVSFILKLSFAIIGVPVGLVFLLGLLALVAAYAFRAEEMPSIMSCWMVAKVMAGVLRTVAVLFRRHSINSGNSFFKRNKEISKEPNSNDGGNIGNGVKIAGGVIESGGEIGNSLE